MIIVKLVGGHSNQLFQYAAARRLSHHLGSKLCMDLSWFKEEVPQGDTRRFYELDVYSIEQNLIGSNKFALVHDDAANLKTKIYPITKGFFKPRIKLYREPSHRFDKHVLKLPDNTYLDGFWQNEKYFIDIRPTLLKELEPTNALTSKNKQYLKDIRSSNAIAIHVRRGDYVDNIMANKFHGVMPTQYYYAALKYLKTRAVAKKLKLFIFSNDIKWCQKNLQFSDPTVFVEGNKKGSDDMRLMKHCKHNVLANSSFSWWGAWLNENPTKIVIAPKQWFQDKKANAETEIIPKSWIRL